jgi:hypothetical protein
MAIQCPRPDLLAKAAKRKKRYLRTAEMTQSYRLKQIVGVGPWTPPLRLLTLQAIRPRFLKPTNSFACLSSGTGAPRALVVSGAGNLPYL